MSSICRLCASLKKIGNFVSIRDPDLNLCHKLKKCCDLYINDDDNLPQNVCIECVQCLEKSWNFFTRVQEAQESLINVFGCPENKSQDEHNMEVVAKLSKNINVSKLQSSLSQQHDESYGEQIIVVDNEYKNEENNYIKSEEFIMEDLSTESEQNIVQQHFEEEFNQNDEDDVYEIYDVRDFNEEKEEVEQNDTGNDDEKIDYEIIAEENVNDDGLDNSIVVINEEKNETWNDYPWKCTKCSLFLTSITNLKMHTSEKHENNAIIEYFCVDCMKVYKKYYTFINHVKYRHRNYLQLCCDLCFKILKSSKELANHRTKVHSNDDLVLCSTCGKAFKNLSSLQIHLNCHEPYEMKYKYECDFCDKKFGTKPNLNAHRKIHLGTLYKKTRKGL